MPRERPSDPEIAGRTVKTWIDSRLQALAMTFPGRGIIDTGSYEPGRGLDGVDSP